MDRGVHAFRGIPYAAPPTGGQRFRSPEPPEAWVGIRDGRPFAPSAPQNPPHATRFFTESHQRQDEDCLYLNVWTPAFDGIPRPVLVWIHGGEFVSGSAAAPDTCGRRLAQRGDAVVVTIQYRLGALGFLYLPELAPANLGLQDQVAALRWVRDEIDAFGGDPSRVTVLGSDAGATSAVALMNAPEARGLFHRVIAQSGSYIYHPKEHAAETAEVFLSELGSEIGNVPIQDASTEALLRAQRGCELRHRSWEGAFQPVVDGRWLPRSPFKPSPEPGALQTPLLLGSNTEEMRLDALLDPELPALPNHGVLNRVARLVGPRGELGQLGSRRLVDAYQRLLPQSSAAEIWSMVQTDRRFRFPALKVADLHSRSDAATYHYTFDGLRDSLSTAPSAFHGMEIPFVFGTLEDHALRAVVGKSPESTSLAKRMQDAWLAFASTGDPSHREIGTWPRYNSGDRATMWFGKKSAIDKVDLNETHRVWMHLEGDLL